MGPPRQQLEHAAGVIVVDGLGEDVVVEVDRGVGREHADAAVAVEQVCDLVGLVDGDPFDVGARVFTAFPRLVDVGRLDPERQAELPEQFVASRRLRRENELAVTNCAWHNS